MTPRDLPGGLIDAHHHLWDLEAVHYPWLMTRGIKRFFGDPTPIQRNYGLPDFWADHAGLPMRASIHVQVGAAPQSEIQEAHWVAGQANAHNWPLAQTAYCDLAAPEREEILDKLQAIPMVRGIRQIIGRHPDEDRHSGSPALLDNAHFIEGLDSLARRGLHFEVQVTDALLPAATRLFARLPTLKTVLCHCGSPWDQSAEGLRAHAQNLADFATLPNSFAKLSGFGMFDTAWTPDRLAPIIGMMLEHFGPDRLMWGSNFPVDKLHRGYVELFETLWSLVPEAARAAVFAGTARRFYGLT